ncbi:MAG: acetate uptake transporter [Aeromicrobium sp.]
MTDTTKTRVAATAADDHPDVLGLWGFALAALFGNLPATGVLAEAGIFTSSLVVIGGFLQLVAGSRESRHGNSFGATSFTAFGFFWITLELNQVLAAHGLIGASSHSAIGLYLLVWGLFAIMLNVGALRLSAALNITVALSWLGLLLRAAGALVPDAAVDRLGAWAFVVCAVAAAYTAASQFLMAQWSRPVLPVGGGHPDHFGRARRGNENDR